jgi:hypothetical protein
MGGVPKPVLYVVAIGLALSAAAGFVLGIVQGDRRTAASDAVPIAANLPANVVIKDAQPLPPPPPPPPPAPKTRPQEDDQSDAAPDQSPGPAGAAAAQNSGPATPPPAAPPPSKPGGSLPDDLPPI